MKTAQALFVLTIAVNLWNYPDRSINEITSWFSKNEEQESQVLGTADLTGETIIEDQSRPGDLTVKLDSTQTALDKMYLDYQQMTGEAVLMGLKWDDLTVSEILQSLDRLNATLSENNKLSWLIQSWGWPQLDTVMARESAVKTNLTTVRSVVSTSGMQPAAYDQLRDAALDMEQIAAVIGVETDTASERTLYGRYRQARESATLWDDLILQLGQIQASGNYVALTQVWPQVIALNALPNPASGVELLALARANKAMLAQDHGSTVTTTWLEENPMRFKTLVSNTSLLSRQQVAIKYYLPIELQESDILNMDPGLQTKMDPKRQRLFVEGVITMAAGDTRVVSVETADLWQFDPTRVVGIQSQTTELVNSLLNKSKFAEAVGLKGDIEVIAQKIADLYLHQTTPEERIQAYRQTTVLMAALDTKFTLVKQLAVKKGFSGWPELAMVSGGMGFMAMGVRLLWRHQTTAPARFNVFPSGIASSDL